MKDARHDDSGVPTMEDARAALKRHFGYDDFRRRQVDVVASVISGRDTLGVLPTGGGKSLCYQVPALVLPGLTVVISPLISLMKDQVDRLEKLGIAATFLNSTLPATEVSARMRRATEGILKLLYVAPERFEAADLRRCLERCGVSLLAVDEAHCISEWGHEFRPSFRRIAGVAEALGIPQRMALTATATPHVRRDILSQLRLRNPSVIVAGFDRANLSYAVRRCREDDDKEKQLLHTLRSNASPAIVYASTRATVERVTRRIGRVGLRTLPYHGGLTVDHRRDVQERFMAGDVDCLVATNAFGMGIDKPNVRLVVHYAMPGTLEAYYQEAGRAGRDGLPGRCILLHARDDRATHEYFIARMFPPRRDVERAYDEMRAQQVDGVVADGGGRWDSAIVQFLQSAGAVTRRRPSRGAAHVRLLATPARIARELPPSSPDRRLLRILWRRSRGALAGGRPVNLTRLGPDVNAQDAKPVLDRLQERQFLHVDAGQQCLLLTDARAPLSEFRIDWTAGARRAASERAKLDAMERYVYTRACRRAFVLSYFGERTSVSHCQGCDNCQSPV
ncbi:MAG: RecQ family ATP-dependent DNA helicase [Gemmatimonadaceae bacterium]